MSRILKASLRGGAIGHDTDCMYKPQPCMWVKLELRHESTPRSVTEFPIRVQP